MNKTTKNSLWLVLIYSIGMIIFILAFSAFLLPGYTDAKALTVFSDDYVEFDAARLDGKADISLILDSLPEDSYDYVAVDFYISGGKAVYSGKDLNIVSEEDMVSGRCFSQDEYETGANVAMVNQNHLDMCVQEDGDYYLKREGEEYQVVGIYKPLSTEEVDDTRYFLNLTAENLSDNTYFDSIYLDAGTETVPVAEAFIRRLEQAASVSDVSYSRYSGKQTNVFDNREAFVLIIAAAGVLVCMNCMSFTITWLQGLRKEYGIRRMTGASGFQNFVWLLKSYFLNVLLSALIGTGGAGIIFFLLGRASGLPSLKNLFGTSLRWPSLLLAVGSVAVLGFVIVQIGYVRLRRKGILETVR